MSIKGIYPRRELPGKRELNRAIRKAHETAGSAGEVMIDRTTATWNNHNLKAKAETKGRGGDYVTTLKLSPEKAAEIWHYLDEGTDVRYALMTPDFSPKTRPGALDSVAGTGGVIIVDLEHPRPGIEARGWSKLIAEAIGDILVNETKKELAALW